MHNANFATQDNEVRYCIIPEEFKYPGTGKYTSYGIRINDCDYEDVIHDVILDEDQASLLVNYLNKYHVSPLHVMQVIEDYIMQ